MYTDLNGQTFYKVALHLHTTLSDGKLTPGEVAELYRSAGFDAIAFTDHWHYGEGKELKKLHIIPGCEYNLDPTDSVMHIVGIGMENDPKLKKETSSRQEIIDSINARGGIAVLAHPAWSLNTLKDASELHGFTAVEIYNAISEQGQSLRAYSDHFVDACMKEGLYFGIFATDDAHYYGEIDDRKGWIMVKADALNDGAILAAIKNRDFYASQGPHLDVRKENGRLIIDCSPCDIVAVLTNMAWAPNRTSRGKDITHFEYVFKSTDKWARVEVRDSEGRRAWSNVFTAD